MSANQFGSRFVITTFGESHGAGLGVVIDGCPAGVKFDELVLKKELERRRPGFHGSGQIVSGRHEVDAPEILSGVFEGVTLGTPIAMLVRNQDHRSQDYKQIQNNPRAGHADDMWKGKFGHSDYRGGGRSSGRETVSRVMASAVAKMMMKQISASIDLVGYSSQIGPFSLTDEERELAINKDIDSFQARFPSSRDQDVAKILKEAQENGESYGGVAEILIKNPPAYLGQPVFHKLKSDLAQAFLSIGATSGFELGLGFESSKVTGTEFHKLSSSPNYGGIRGGISTGENILMKISFKPTSSIMDVAKKGRHDPCIVTRAIPVLEAMTWLVLADHYLWSRTDKI
ncbi:MAG: chorismate synthase [Bdellovibrio sp.]